MARTNNLADQRLREIETLLLWEGEVGNSRLRDLYAIGIGAASILLRGYREQFPNYCNWNSIRRVFELDQEHARPTLTSGAIGDYSQLLDRGALVDDSVIHDAHIDLTAVNHQIFSTFHKACSRRLGVETLYASVTTPVPKSRLLFPHALVRAGRRWHIRAFDCQSQEFRDFTLGRVMAASLTGACPVVDANMDAAWHTDVSFQIVPHPKLDDFASEVIRREYMGTSKSRSVSCRAAMLNYVLQEMRAAIDVETELPPNYQLAILSLDQLRPWLYDATPVDSGRQP